MHSSFTGLYILLLAMVFCNGSYNNLGMSFTSNITSKIMKDYNKEQIPLMNNKSNSKISPLEVQLELFIKNIHYLEDINMEFSIQFALRMKWLDYRLSYEDFLSNEYKNFTDFKDTFIVIHDTNTIWYPDLTFPNEKRGKRHNILQPNILIRVRPNGIVQYSIRLSMVFYCPMELHWYPFDTHKCEIPIWSYSYQLRDMKLYWHKSQPIEFPASLNRNSFGEYWVKHIPHFQLVNFTADSCDFVNEIGSWTCAVAYFTFTRQLSFYFITIFLPCGIIVIISWISFWFDVSALDARVALGITTILTMTNHMQGINQMTSAVSYFRAADIFTMLCLIFVALSLLEFAIVDFTLRGKLNLSRLSSVTVAVKPASIEDTEKGFGEQGTAALFENRIKASRIDKYSRILFPLCFLGFIIVYFTVCLLKEL